VNLSRPTWIVVLALAGGCAPSLATMQPAHVAPKGHMQVTTAFEVGIPTGTIGSIIDTGKTISDIAQRDGMITPEQERQLAGVHEPLHVLLDGEPDRSEWRDPPRGEPAEAALLQREPHERERREHEHGLRHMREVFVDGSRVRPGEPISDRMRDEDAGRSDRRHQDPGQQAPTHVHG